ncbi:hypothetical protein DCC81_22620 [Chitinophaga parva]|uniref:Peptidase S54 rhomboid domain-containing protein n=2 Tax=Chitinophaga parva TaxID=2169414 RepID=A0A2T7BDM2_9BACT|nr:hypothetical protein DCC81_22620 [Chitinophaga parva]
MAFKINLYIYCLFIFDFSMQTKTGSFKVFFFPFLYTAVLFIALYIFGLYRLRNVPGIAITEDMLVWGPVLLVVIPCLLLRPRAKRLVHRESKSTLTGNLLFAAALAMALPLVLMGMGYPPMYQALGFVLGLVGVFYLMLQTEVKGTQAPVQVYSQGGEHFAYRPHPDERPLRPVRPRANPLFFLRPRPGYFVTPIIIDLNILVFIIMVIRTGALFGFSSETLMQWGANNGYAVLIQHQYYRMLTAVFVHGGGLIHIFSNMYALLFAGVVLEPVLGAKRYAIMYLLTGIMASAVSIFIHPDVVSSGASGAVFGMYGGLIALMVARISSPHIDRVTMGSMIFFVGYNLAFGLIPGIDNAAHIGGLVTGFIVGLLYVPGLRKRIRGLREDSRF